MSKRPEEVAEELREKERVRQWIEKYKHYQRLIDQAKAELAEE